MKKTLLIIMIACFALSVKAQNPYNFFQYGIAVGTKSTVATPTAYGFIDFYGSTSGRVRLKAPAVAGTTTFTLGTTTGMVSTTQNINDSLSAAINAASLGVLLADSGKTSEGNYITNLQLTEYNYQKKLLEGLGGTVKDAGYFPLLASANLVMTNHQVLANVRYIFAKTIITGACFISNVAGTYNENQYNGIGLYKLTGTTWNLVALSKSTPSLWKASANTLITQAFDSTGAYNADIGVYAIAALWTSSDGSPAVVPKLYLESIGAYIIKFRGGGTNFLSWRVSGTSDTFLPVQVLSSNTVAANPWTSWLY